MKASYLASLAIASVLSLGLLSCSGSTVSESVDAADTTANTSDVDPCAGADDPCASPCASASDSSSSEATTVSFFAEDGVAIRGADPVAYFTQGDAVIGSPEFEYEWNGATWRFASAEHRDLFASNPEDYAPQYGGFCAWAVSQGYTAEVDPEAWRIVDGKLYLNYSQKIQERWSRDIPGHIAKADENWPGVLDQ